MAKVIVVTDPERGPKIEVRGYKPRVLGGAPPMGLAGPPPGGPPPGMPPMGHKRGGRAKGGMVHMTAGAGGARGRLEKVKIQENSRR